MQHVCIPQGGHERIGTGIQVNESNGTCVSCGLDFPREVLATRQVRFRRLGQAGKVIRSKNVGNYCPSCMDLEVNIESIPPIVYHREVIRLREELNASRQG